MTAFIKSFYRGSRGAVFSKRAPLVAISKEPVEVVGLVERIVLPPPGLRWLWPIGPFLVSTSGYRGLSIAVGSIVVVRRRHKDRLVGR